MGYMHSIFLYTVPSRSPKMYKIEYTQANTGYMHYILVTQSLVLSWNEMRH